MYYFLKGTFLNARWVHRIFWIYPFIKWFTCDSKHHASNLEPNGIACNTFIASGINSANILYLQIAIRTDMKLATLCHLYTILKGIIYDALRVFRCIWRLHNWYWKIHSSILCYLGWPIFIIKLISLYKHKIKLIISDIINALNITDINGK